jgi:lysophospholipase L1-like esterase
MWISRQIASRIIAAGLAALPLIVGGCAPDPSGSGTTTGGTGGAAGGSVPSGTGGGDGVGSGGTTGIGDAGVSGSGGVGVDAGGDGRAATGGGGGAPAGNDAGTTATGGRGGSGAGGVGSGTGGRAGAGGATGIAGAGGPVTVFIASDSTASTYAANAANMQAGWGQMLPMYFNTMVRVSNQAIGGRTSRRFINEGRLTTILNAMKPGDYLLVQFGTNDGNTMVSYDDGEPYFVSTTDFEGFMGMYIDGARGKQGIPILVTPPPRASCTGDSHSFGNGLAGYSTAMKNVAAAKSAALIDLNAETLAYVDMIGCIAAKADFYLLNDGTHFQQNGARIMAGFVADGVVELGLPLAAYRLP